MPWQRQVADVAGELLPNGRPAYRDVRVTVPRQSGKTTTILVVEVDRATMWGPRQHVVYAAQDRISARAKLEEQADILSTTPVGHMFTMRRQTGLEQLVWSNHSTIGITASGKTSGHGPTVDLAVIDEGWSQTDYRLEQAFRPAMVTRADAQLWVVTTAGTDESVYWNDLLDDGRTRVEADQRSGVCYFEWSADPEEDPDDPETWMRCMPALGHTVDLDTIRADHDTMEPGEFARAFLNIRRSGGRAVFEPADWAACYDPRSQPGPSVTIGFDVTPDRDFGAIAICSRGHVEVVDHRPGPAWMVSRLLELQRKWAPWRVLYEAGSPASSLRLDLIAAGVKAEPVDGREYGRACESFFDDVVAHRVRHLGQPALDAAVIGARKRHLGDSWALARRVGTDMSPAVAVVLARWGWAATGSGVAQII